MCISIYLYMCINIYRRCDSRQWNEHLKINYFHTHISIYIYIYLLIEFAYGKVPLQAHRDGRVQKEKCATGQGALVFFARCDVKRFVQQKWYLNHGANGRK